MPSQPLNDWSPWMRALTASGMGVNALGGLEGGDSQQPMEIPAEVTAASTPAQPSTTTPPAHRIEDDRTAGTRGVTPQGDDSGLYAGATYHAQDPARLPLEQQIGKDRGELARMNAPSKSPSLLQRMAGLAGGALAGATDQTGEVMALRDRVAARKQQERENLSNRIEQSTRQLSSEGVATQRMQEQERLRALANQALMDRVNLQQQGANERNQATIAGKAQLQEDKPTPTPKPTFEEQQYQEWATGQKAAGKPTDRMTFDRIRKAQDRAPRPPSDRDEWMQDHPGEPVENYWKARAGAAVEAKTAGAEKTKLETMSASVQYANDYVQKGIYTGPGDEALQEKFFDLARPEKGFRMTDSQMKMLRQGREWIGSLEGQFRHATTGTWFSEKQRQQIASTMNDIYKANKETVGGGGDNTPRPANVPGDWIHKKGPKGSGWYPPNAK